MTADTKYHTDKVKYSETNFEENLKNAIFNSEKISKKSENTENNSREKKA